jgi:hypothetical protein
MICSEVVGDTPIIFGWLIGKWHGHVGFDVAAISSKRL